MKFIFAAIIIGTTGLQAAEGKRLMTEKVGDQRLQYLLQTPNKEKKKPQAMGLAFCKASSNEEVIPPHLLLFNFSPNFQARVTLYMGANFLSIESISSDQFSITIPALTSLSWFSYYGGRGQP